VPRGGGRSLELFANSRTGDSLTAVAAFEQRGIKASVAAVRSVESQALLMPSVNTSIFVDGYDMPVPIHVIAIFACDATSLEVGLYFFYLLPFFFS